MAEFRFAVSGGNVSTVRLHDGVVVRPLRVVGPRAGDNVGVVATEEAWFHLSDNGQRLSVSTPIDGSVVDAVELPGRAVRMVGFRDGVLVQTDFSNVDGIVSRLDHYRFADGGLVSQSDFDRRAASVTRLEVRGDALHITYAADPPAERAYNNLPPREFDDVEFAVNQAGRGADDVLAIYRADDAALTDPVLVRTRGNTYATFVGDGLLVQHVQPPRNQFTFIADLNDPTSATPIDLPTGAGGILGGVIGPDGRLRIRSLPHADYFGPSELPLTTYAINSDGSADVVDVNNVLAGQYLRLHQSATAGTRRRGGSTTVGIYPDLPHGQTWMFDGIGPATTAEVVDLPGSDHVLKSAVPIDDDTLIGFTADLPDDQEAGQYASLDQLRPLSFSPSALLLRRGADGRFVIVDSIDVPDVNGDAQVFDDGLVIRTAQATVVLNIRGSQLEASTFAATSRRGDVHYLPDGDRVWKLDGGGATAITESDSGENRNDPMDVNGDDRVTPLDALTVLNAMRRRRVGTESIPGAASDMTTADVNGDGAVSPIDALLILNRLRRGAAESVGSEAFGPEGANASEPSKAEVPSPIDQEVSGADAVDRIMSENDPIADPIDGDILIVCNTGYTDPPAGPPGMDLEIGGGSDGLPEVEVTSWSLTTRLDADG